MSLLKAGAAQVDISPKNSQFLFGYPHVKRYSTGIHDKLWSSALYLSDGKTETLFIANDIIFVSKDSSASARKRIQAKTGIPAQNIMITATHTHSGPITLDYLSNQNDPVVPKTDANYVRLMEDGIVQAALTAYQTAQPATVGLAIANDTGVGTNRRNPEGPADHQVPVLLVKNADTNVNIACMLVCSMHPTVLHEDSTLVSGDFPGMARLYLQKNVLGENCPVLHHTGPSGNQSPRHVTKANTFEEAERLGKILGRAVETKIANLKFKSELPLSAAGVLLNDLPRRTFPSVQQAQDKLDRAIKKLETLRKDNAPRQEIRTAECDWFGAEETLTLSKAAQSGQLQETYKKCLPAEIQVFQIGPWKFVGWQGEIFIEYALRVKHQSPNTFVISIANGEMQGYVVTQEAFDEGGYEASNALFGPEAGAIFVEKTLELLK
ncbi:MAG: neutral/alkaline non-lysosomal ceramidase N-terminal domain-containing protein [Planctomycetaceae bacterium]|nr:neutral/alkaline non-lysosomal ceramidase N-terminal domain-containing protein [Planctomycetaceae bacterium]